MSVLSADVRLRRLSEFFGWALIDSDELDLDFYHFREYYFCEEIYAMLSSALDINILRTYTDVERYSSKISFKYYFGVS